MERHVCRKAFFTPEAGVSEATSLLPTILKQRGTPAPDAIRRANELLAIVWSYVRVVQFSDYRAHEAAARRRLAGRDESDWPYLALAMALDCPLWTEDRDFFGTGIATWTSDLVEIYLESAV